MSKESFAKTGHKNSQTKNAHQNKHKVNPPNIQMTALTGMIKAVQSGYIHCKENGPHTRTVPHTLKNIYLACKPTGWPLAI